MSLDELVTAFKEILLTPPEHLSAESQHAFQQKLKITPSPLLFKLRSLLEIMQNQIPAKNYKHYSAILKALLDTQESLPGRISPDILEPLSDGYLSHTEIIVPISEKVEITTGTSIWALFLKRQLQDRNRVDQRHLKCVIILSSIVKNSISRLLAFSFLSIHHTQKPKIHLKKFLESLTNLLKSHLTPTLRHLSKYSKQLSQLNKKKKQNFSILIKRLEKLSTSRIKKRFKSWHLSSTLSLSRSCISPVLPEKEISELELRLNSTQSMPFSHSETVLKMLSNKLYELHTRVVFSSFFNIKLYSISLLLMKGLNSKQEKSQHEKMMKKLEEIFNVKYLKILRKALNHYKSTTVMLILREKALKSISTFLKFKLIQALNSFSKNSFRKSLISSKLHKRLHNLTTNHLRNYFSKILAFHKTLKKQGFDAFIHNSYTKNIEKINKAWRDKLKISEKKWQEKISLENSRFASGDFFSQLCRSIQEKLLRFSIQQLRTWKSY